MDCCRDAGASGKPGVALADRIWFEVLRPVADEGEHECVIGEFEAECCARA
jgi:hypothetical protein